jgi:DNA-binding transcriptional LysR family regulator
LDLWQLKIFIKVMETGSFSKASEAIHLTQPTVSSHIKDLETYFNCRLLDRLGKESIPTGAGRILYSYARRLLDLHDEAEGAIHDFMGNIKGSLLIGGSTIPAGYIIPGFVKPFRTRFPGIDISVISGDSMQIIDHVLAGKVEIGIAGAIKDHPDLSRKSC